MADPHCGHAFDDQLGPNDSISVVFGLNPNWSQQQQQQQEQAAATPTHRQLPHMHQHGHTHSHSHSHAPQVPPSAQGSSSSSSWYLNNNNVQTTSSSPSPSQLVQLPHSHHSQAFSSWYDVPASSPSPSQLAPLPHLHHANNIQDRGVMDAYLAQVHHQAQMTTPTPSHVSSQVHHQQPQPQQRQQQQAQSEQNHQAPHPLDLDPYPVPGPAPQVATTSSSSSRPASVASISAATQHHRGLNNRPPPRPSATSIVSAPATNHQQVHSGGGGGGGGYSVSRANTHVGVHGPFGDQHHHQHMQQQSPAPHNPGDPFAHATPCSSTQSQLPLPSNNIHDTPSDQAYNPHRNPFQRAYASSDDGAFTNSSPSAPYTTPSVVAFSEAPPRPFLPSSSPLAAAQQRRNKQKQPQATPPSSRSSQLRRLQAANPAGPISSPSPVGPSRNANPSVTEQLCTLLEQSCALSLQLRGQSMGQRSAFARETLQEARRIRDSIKELLHRNYTDGYGNFDQEFGDLFRVYFGPAGLDE